MPYIESWFLLGTPLQKSCLDIKGGCIMDDKVKNIEDHIESEESHNLSSSNFHEADLLFNCSKDNPRRIEIDSIIMNRNQQPKYSPLNSIPGDY